MKLFRSLLLLLPLLLMLAGCVTQNLNLVRLLKLDSDPNAPPFVEVIPQRMPLQESDLPTDARLVIATLVNQMYLEPGLPREIAFVPGGRHQLYDPDFDYTGFLLHHIDVSSYDVHNLGATVEVTLDGVLHFGDLLGRRTAVRYFARYTPSAKGVLVLESQLRPIQPTFPEVKCFFVPEEKLKRVPRGVLDSYQAWYLFALENAETMTPTAKEIKERAKYDSLSLLEKLKQAPQREPIRYAILLFAMDRIVDNGQLLVNFSNFSAATPIEPAHMDVTMVDESGWKFAMVGAKFAIDSWGNIFYVNVTYAPDLISYKNKGYPVRVGSFSNQKNYAQDQLKPQSAAVVPVNKAERILNPADRNDAIRIQSRLADLGFYTSAIDGMFGKGSRAALQKFRQSRELGNSSEWDLRVQQALFSGAVK